jgi:hypothetical protein
VCICQWTCNIVADSSVGGYLSLLREPDYKECLKRTLSAGPSVGPKRFQLRSWDVINVAKVLYVELSKHVHGNKSTSSYVDSLPCARLDNSTYRTFATFITSQLRNWNHFGLTLDPLTGSSSSIPCNRHQENRPAPLGQAYPKCYHLFHLISLLHLHYQCNLHYQHSTLRKGNSCEHLDL